ncbi:hypothetical protein GMMP15_1490017 [Candidatus Magnetomoraceae bacterium gMMP-15]
MHDTTANLKNFLTGIPGCRKVADDYIYLSKHIKKAGLVDTITYGIKCPENSFFERAMIYKNRFLKVFPDILHLIMWQITKIPTPVKIKIKKLFKIYPYN